MGKVQYDQKDGIGAIPWNQDVDYRGFRVWMTPEKFLQCAARLPFPNALSSLYIQAGLKSGKAIASPYLGGKWDGKTWKIGEHEGRHRAMAVSEFAPGELMEVHFIPVGQGIRARDIDETMIKSFADFVIGEKGNRVDHPTNTFLLRGEKIKV